MCKLKSLILGVFVLLLAFAPFSAWQANDKAYPSSSNDADYLQMLIWDKVVEKYQFSGLAQYYNNIDYFLIEDSELLVFPEGEPITLSANQWFVAVGRFNVLLINADKLIIENSMSLLMTENSQALSEASAQILVLSKSELAAFSKAFDVFRYHHLWYGFAAISRFVESSLLFLHENLIGNWGLVIILFAILVKILLLPLSIMTSRLQRKVSQIQAKLEPKLQKIKASYDGEEAHNLIMAAHKELDVSPFYSLKPLFGTLIQIPILIGIFNALGEMHQFNGVSFLWIDNLAYPDSLGHLPIHIPLLGQSISLLPVLMTVVTILSTILFANPDASVGELRKQKRNLFLMAVAFFILFYPFPAVMVFYWTCSNLLHIVQQKLVKA